MIPFCEPLIKDQYAYDVYKQVLSGEIGSRETTKAFAKAISEYTGARYVVLTTSGTSALQLAGRAFGLENGSTIVVPAYGFNATVNAFASIGCKIATVDINKTTGCICPKDLEQKLKFNKSIKAVCYVNFSGYTGPNLHQIKQLCKLNKVILIEDSACGLGHFYKDSHAGTIAQVGILSFSVPKLITTGQGGALLLKNEYQYFKVLDYINQGNRLGIATVNSKTIGCNMRFNDILAAIGLSQLKDIEQVKKRKLKVHDYLAANLPVYKTPSGAPLHNIVFSNDRDRLLKILAEAGVEAMAQYNLVWLNTPYNCLRSILEKVFSGADYWHRKAVYFPFSNSLTDHDVCFMTEVLLENKDLLI